MVVGNQQVGLGVVVVHLARQVFLRQRGDHLATPTLQQGAHAGANRRIVIQHPHPCTTQALEHRLAHRLARLGLGCRGAQRHFDREHRTFAKPRTHADPVAEDAGDLLHDRQAQAQPAVLVRALHITALEFQEHVFQVLLGNADATVPYLDPQATTQAPTPQHHTPAAGITDGIAEQVAQNARQQLDVAAHHGRTAHEVQRQPFAARHLGVFGG